MGQLKAATAVSKSILVSGDFNLDASRADDSTCTRKTMLEVLDNHGAPGLFLPPNIPHMVSTIYHVYCLGLRAMVNILPDGCLPWSAPPDCSTSFQDWASEARRHILVFILYERWHPSCQLKWCFVRLEASGVWGPLFFLVLMDDLPNAVGTAHSIW